MTPSNDVFFDFVCPYAWRGVELAQVLRKAGEQTFTLRHFSLVQGNHPDNAGQSEPAWWLTDQPAESGERFQQSSLLAFLAAGAAARQGEEQSWDFTLALFRAVHEEKKPLDEDAVMAAARAAKLDLEQFSADRQDDEGLRASLRQDLAEAAEIGVFGTPTFVLPGGEAAYYRFENLTRELDTARQWWKLYGEVLHSGAGIATVKRAKNRPAKKAAHKELAQQTA
ncbi:DSBA oxidoreductase [Deinococcus radiopugnans]|uniref:DSBA oxidoreductase n=1 Tax=Deinococcus radiopugnans TaxID=57497 RepID=A0A0A7KD84_9DEIO|nr:DsbA family protein [Deinococcus radiopugnans]AIZ44070.1 DSBA oxidoreductase [Deinococcus radiopugnans]